MPLDHYVSQVHLRQFSSPDRAGHLRAMRKSTLEVFPCRPQDVCRVADGNTNAYLQDPRAVEDFLRGIEPFYNQALHNLRNNLLTVEDIRVIAGFLSYVSCCTPTAIRTGVLPLQRLVETTARMLDAQGVFGDAPPELGNRTMTQLLEDGAVGVTVDRQYPLAIGIQGILQRTSLFGNSPWEVIRNPYAQESPFLTSDFPASLEASNDPRVMNRILPLAPDIAVRVWPDIALPRGVTDFTFANHRQRRLNASFDQVSKINRTIVRNAEELIFHGPELIWLPNLVRRNNAYRVQSLVDVFPQPNGELLLNRLRVVESVA